MKVLVLAAGYGTRLSRDLQAQGPRGQYAHLVGVAKPLLPIGGIPLISHWMALLGGCSETQGEVYVVVSHQSLMPYVAICIRALSLKNRFLVIKMTTYIQ